MTIDFIQKRGKIYSFRLLLLAAMTINLSSPADQCLAYEKKRTVAAVIISGNEKTKGFVIRDALTFVVGSEITDKEIESSRQNLQNLGLFYDIVIEEIESAVEGYVRIEISVKEKWSILPLPLISRSDEGDITAGINYQDYNLQGRGNYLKIKAYKKWANDFKDDLGGYYSLGLTLKKFIRDDFTFSPRIEQGNSLEVLYEEGKLISRYKKYVQSYGAAISRDFGLFDASFGFSARKNSYTLLEGPPQPYHDIKIVSIGTSIGIDRKNDLGNYTYDGYNISLSIDNASDLIGSDANATTYSASFSHYIRIEERTNIAYRIKTTLVTGSDEEDFRTGVGGSGSLRGYRRDQFQGDRMVQINSEYRFPITDRYWGGTIFVDAGNAWEKGAATGINDLQWGAGLGLRLFIKRLVNGVGRLDVAYNFSDNEVEAYLGVGHTF